MPWESIHAAVQVILDGGAKRVDGEGWTVYRVGNAIRIDLAPELTGAAVE